MSQDHCVRRRVLVKVEEMVVVGEGEGRKEGGGGEGRVVLLFIAV